jgi:glycosyltransferase involved in cell wall biosynthesis
MKSKILYIGNRLSTKGKTFTTIDTLSVLLESEGYEVKKASSVSNKILRILDMCQQTFKQRDWADYVLMDTYSTMNFWYAITVAGLCRSLGLKYIPILHGGNLPHRLKTHPRILKNFLNKAHKLVSPSDYLKHAFAKAGFHNIQAIPNSIELEKYEFKARENVQPKLLWVRSFAAIYNPLMAVKVLEALKTSFPEAQLTMVGPDKDGSLELCKNWANDKGLSVTFTGLLPKTEWTTLAAAHDIFINTSRFDNMPVSVIEAMALGLPIVSTNVGGIPFMIQNRVNGMLVPDNDVLAMKAAIEELIKNSKLVSDISINAREFTEKLDWLQIKKLWNNLLAI